MPTLIGNREMTRPMPTEIHRPNPLFEGASADENPFTGRISHFVWQ